MLIFVALLVSGMASVAVTALLLRRLLEDDPAPPAPRVARRPALEASAFFGEPPAAPRPRSRVPIEVLLSQIERHVRLERVAAEMFLDVPTAKALHGKTTSPLVN